MLAGQSPYRSPCSQQAVRSPALGLRHQRRPSASITLPIVNGAGVGRRNFGANQASETTELDIGNLLLTLFMKDYDDTTVDYCPLIVETLHTLSTSDEICLINNSPSLHHDKPRLSFSDQQSFHLDATSDPKENTCFNPRSVSKPLTSRKDCSFDSSSDTRSLTEIINGPLSIMTTAVSGPGSPPELSESQSSKSSSYGSNFSSPEGFCSGITNFEDIGLDDEEPTVVNTANGYGSRVGAQVEGKEEDTKKKHPKRPSLSGLQTESKPYIRSTENGIKSAHVTRPKRGFSSPIVESVDRMSRTRSASPPMRAFPPRSASSGKYSPTSTLNVPLRRGSWQPARKTIKEIEDEYHESDDELPDDASLFNVPVSPFPAGPTSRRSSINRSPERINATTSPRPIPLAHAQTAPDVPQIRKNSSSQPTPRHRLTPRSSSNNLSKSSPSSPETGSLRNGRSKSWNLAMSHLSYEARVISENLAYHSENTNEQQDEPIITNRSSAPSAIPLPPIQKGTLDFMPISKEKEAILSRTRPSWLPPKDPKEEKRHLKQYQEMMKAAMEAEKRRDEKLKDQETVKDQTRVSLNKIWTYYIEPTTDIVNIDPRVHELCWRGVTPRLRGQVWQRRMGNSLGLNAISYQKALQRAQEIKATSTKKLTDIEKKMISWFVDIERDAETAFPELKMFQRDCQHWQDLINVCEAYTTYCSDVGYIYGLQLVAALLLLHLPDPTEVFILLANCLNQPLPMAFQTGDTVATRRAFLKIKSTLEIKFPQLHDYLFMSQESGGLGFTGDELFYPIFQTLFANGLDADRLSRVWDIWIFEGDRTLIRAAVALLGSLRTQIFDLKGDTDLKRRNIQEMLAWGPCLRSESGYWQLDALGSADAFIEELRNASRLDHTGK